MTHHKREIKLNQLCVTAINYAICSSNGLPGTISDTKLLQNHRGSLIFYGITFSLLRARSINFPSSSLLRYVHVNYQREKWSLQLSVSYRHVNHPNKLLLLLFPPSFFNTLSWCELCLPSTIPRNLWHE